jgi:hypothetical protein
VRLVYELLALVVAVFLFNIGLMLMDYGATFRDIGYLQTFVFERIETRVAYHSGVILAVASFFLLVMLCVHHISVQKCGKEIP